MVRVFAAVVCGVLLGGCAGKSSTGGDGSGGYIEAGGKGSGESGSTSTGGAPGSAGSGSGGLVTSGEPCSAEGARATNGCADCNCAEGAWVCGHKVCNATMCGWFYGDTCAPNEYCAFEAYQLCGTSDVSSTCQPRPQVCLEDYSPVCGCDGKNYGNACSAAMHGSGVMSVGVCHTSN